MFGASLPLQWMHRELRAFCAKRRMDMEITNHVVEQMKDPTGIIVGDRYEFLLDVEVDEEDELFTEGGLELRVILGVTEDNARIVQYHFADKASKKILDFALEDDEEEEVIAYCKNHLE